MTRRSMIRYLLVFLVATAPGPVLAQGEEAPRAADAPPSAVQPRSSPLGRLDRAAFYRVYRAESPLFVAPIRAAHHSAYAVIFGSAPTMWTIALATGGPRGAAYRLTLSQAGAGLLFSGFKRVVRRPRPHHVLPDVTSRTGSRVEETLDPFSFPSGHATLAAATATSLSLSYGRWYVVAPSALWAAGVALSRVWYGVHYPLDVVAGALLGGTVAAGVHLLGPSITPNAWGEERRAGFALRLSW